MGCATVSKLGMKIFQLYACRVPKSLKVMMARYVTMTSQSYCTILKVEIRRLITPELITI